MAKKPKAPEKTASELELERRQRDEINRLTDEKNARLKAARRSEVGRRSLFGGARARRTSSTSNAPPTAGAGSSGRGIVGMVRRAQGMSRSGGGGGGGIIGLARRALAARQ